MAKGMRIRAKVKDAITEVKVLINHPMETGQRKDKKTGELVPAHFIEEIWCDYSGKTVLRAHWSGGVSKDPYLAFQFKGGAVGETATVAWRDNKGETDQLEVSIQ